MAVAKADGWEKCPRIVFPAVQKWAGMELLKVGQRRHSIGAVLVVRGSRVGAGVLTVDADCPL